MAQEVQTNENGEKIVVFEDGSWRYYEMQDSIYEDPNVLPQQKRTNDYRMFQRYVAAAVAYEAEHVKKLDANKNALYDLEDEARLIPEGERRDSINLRLSEFRKKVQNDQRLVAYSRSLIRKILKIGAKEKYVKLNDIYVPGLSTIRLTDEQIANTDDIVTSRTKPKIGLGMKKDRPDDGSQMSDQTKANKREKGKNRKRRRTKDLVEDPDGTPPKSEEISVPQVVQESNAKIFEINEPSTIQEAASTTDSIGKMADSDSAEENNTGTNDEAGPAKNAEVAVLAEVVDTAEIIQPRSDTTRDEDVAGRDEVEGDVSESALEASKPSLDYAPYLNYSWTSDGSLGPKTYACTFTHDGIDEFTKQQKRELAGEDLFSHTDNRLKPYLKNRDYVSCKAYLTSISGGYRHLTLVITIASRNARREYGYIKSGSLLNLKLLDDKTVSLFCQGDHLGNINAAKGSTTYIAKYPIDFQKEKILSKSQLDRLRIVWSTGYEDYEVYNVDFFQNQLACLNNN